MTNFTLTVSVEFPSPREAEIAYQVLSVDSETKRNKVKKTLTVDANTLYANLSGVEARNVRVGLTSFFDNLTLVTETMKEFGSPKPVYNHFN